MNVRDKDHIARIKEELSFIEETLENVDREAFLHDSMLQHAISMALITIGECANHLSSKFKKSYSEIEWLQIIAVRHIAAHGYWQLNMEQVWQAMEEDIPKLKDFFSRFMN
ncbi:MAG: DUF86 domain-containing protein [Clostridiales bacterium]|jgi:uncharacterized protein with HEPN domain|nr:DUF86 domain-containing protein [Clostridiales bacterium]MDR2713551.1 DUF86 domain-containing protein [Clostridiales bacterium]